MLPDCCFGLSVLHLTEVMSAELLSAFLLYDDPMRECGKGRAGPAPLHAFNTIIEGEESAS